jgi:predicted RNase H-like nuclease (RuvC/YqgF family)
MERLERDNAALQAQVEQLSDRLHAEKGNFSRMTAEMADAQSNLQHQKELTEAKVADLTRRLEAEKEACAKMRESLMADAQSSLQSNLQHQKESTEAKVSTPYHDDGFFA